MPVDRSSPTISEARAAANRVPLGDASNMPAKARKSNGRKKQPTVTQHAEAAEQQVGELTAEYLALQDELAEAHHSLDDMQAELDEAKADARAARREAEAAKTATGKLTSELSVIAKPNGSMKNRCGLMELEEDQDLYRYLMRETRIVAMKTLDRDKTYDDQDEFAMARFCKAVSHTKGLEYLKRFEGNWAAKEFAKTALKSDRARKTKLAANRRNRDSTHSPTPGDNPGSAAED
ncbi:hypothetical protein EXIGLDRAFT_702667 [Exidia glandulosa HHB12029]|uniref:Uncharacterized protein n=1 Tax=Exidia glandulosa HHB12029 TaxID=1314781 RepID=A0A166B460_EXIGL|nr:hypothetical protein EXIGLDRAFT_702667 [Exidia glandulosa HHB12029]